MRRNYGKIIDVEGNDFLADFTLTLWGVEGLMEIRVFSLRSSSLASTEMKLPQMKITCTWGEPGGKRMYLTDKSSRTEVFKLQPAGHLQLNKPRLAAHKGIF